MKKKFQVEGIVTFQNICSSSSIADFRAVVSVLPCSPTNIGKQNLCGCAEKANRQWVFVAFWLSSYVNIKTAAAFANWLAPKKDALFSLIYFFGSFCIYYIPHNYIIPQAIPHAIPQTHSSFYPHRLIRAAFWVLLQAMFYERLKTHGKAIKIARDY